MKRNVIAIVFKIMKKTNLISTQQAIEKLVNNQWKLFMCFKEEKRIITLSDKQINI